MGERKKNVIRNFIWYLYGLTITSVLPFVIRTVMVRFIGIEYTGVNSLFVSILQIINFSDLGFDTVLSFYLYKILAEKDYKNAGIIVNYLRKIYRLVGAVTIAIGIVLIPFLHIFVKDNSYPSGLNIVFIFVIYILNSAIPYLLGGYSTVVFKADQRTDITTKIGITGSLIMYILQIVSICLYKNYYYYSLLLLLSPTILAVGSYCAYRKNYPDIICNGSVDNTFKKSFKSQMISVALSKMRTLSRNSLDSVAISSFLGLEVLAKYQNYYQIIIMALVVVNILHSAIAPSLGNSIALESIEKNYDILKKYTLLKNFVNSICCSCLMVLLQPFMKIWMGEQYLMEFDFVILLCIYFYGVSEADTGVLLRETTGMWNKGRYISVLETIANIVLNFLLVYIWGAKGVVLATIITVFVINIPLEFRAIFQSYFNISITRYMLLQFKNLIVTIVIVIIEFQMFFTEESLNIFELLIKGVFIVITALLLCGVLNIVEIINNIKEKA